VKLKAKDLPDQWQSDNVENPFNDPDPLDFDAAGGLVGFGGPGSKPIGGFIIPIFVTSI